MVVLIYVECEANMKQIQAGNFINNCMLKEPTEMRYFAIQANFHFTDTNFTEVKLDKDPLN